VLALAILRALFAARRKGPIVRQATASVPLVHPAAAFVICCDNLA
jgi:hypothetical protein